MSVALKFKGTVRQKLSISWKKVYVYSEEDTCCGLKESTETEIISEVSGEAKCGRLLAIMGSSGAGKTTLLHTLSGRQMQGFRADGLFAVNGHFTCVETIRLLSAYVAQEDILLSNLTVSEHLTYQGILRLSGGYHYRQIKERINELVKELELESCLDVYIGGLQRKGISGGERKRVVLASEILGCPPILFLDEPTSGLDLHIAEKIIKLLRKLCASGETIICTIHQPSSQMFHQFDDLMLLSNGRVAFSGTLKDAQSFFEQQGYEVPTRFNPADVYIRILAEDTERADEICYAFETSEFYEHIVIDNKPAKINRVDFGASFYTQFMVVMRRTFTINWREKMFGVALIQDFVGALLFSLIFGRQPLNQTGMKNINGTLFFLTLILSFQQCFLEIRNFIDELPLLKRELESGIYSATAAFWGYVVAQLPGQLLSVLMFTVIYYIIIGYGADFARFCNYILTAILLSQAVMSFAYFFRNLLLPMFLTLKMVATILRVSLLLSGTLIDFSTIPQFFHFLRSTSFAYLANEAFVVNQWLKVDNVSCETVKMYKNGTMATIITENCFDTGKKVISSFNYDETNFESDNLKQFILLFVFRIFANFVLCLRVGQF